MRSLFGGLAATAASLLLLAGMASTAQAACGQSTPAAQTFADSVGDDEGGLAPDLSTLTLRTDAACGFAAEVTLADGRGQGGLIDGEAIATYIDADGNAATGSDVFVGADRVVIVSGQTGSDGPPVFGVWNAATRDFDFTNTLPPRGPGPFGFTSTIDAFGLAPAQIGVYVGAIWVGRYDTYGDFSPEPGAAPWRYAVSYNGVAQAPAPAPTPAPAPAPAPTPAPAPQPAPTRPSAPVNKAPATGSSSTTSCHPGKLTGYTLAGATRLASQRGCSVRVRYVTRRTGKVGRVVSVSRHGSTVTLTVSRRPRRARAAIAHALTSAQLEARFELAARG